MKRPEHRTSGCDLTVVKELEFRWRRSRDKAEYVAAHFICA
jgi:hypothetical protein